MQKLLLKVKKNKLIADHIYQMDIEGLEPQFQFDLKDFKPGNFLHIKCGTGIDPLLRRPMSICNIDDKGSCMTILYRKEGKGTAELSEFVPGQHIDILAPLGSDFPLNHMQAGQTALMIGGGIGVPPLYYLARKLKERGVEIKSILGFNSAKDVFLEKEFSELGETFITTVDGSHGSKGFVTHALEEHFKIGLNDTIQAAADSSVNKQNWNTLYSCGPTVMLKALQDIIPKDRDAYISMEERMGCGVGACLACVCKVSDDFAAQSEKPYKRICTEGPVFKMHEIKI